MQGNDQAGAGANSAEIIQSGGWQVTAELIASTQAAISASASHHRGGSSADFQ